MRTAMKNLLILLLALPMVLVGCSKNKQSTKEDECLPTEICGISLGISYDSLSNILKTNNWESSIGTDIGNGFCVCIKSKLPYQNIFLERGYVFVCQKHGTVEVVGVKQFDDYNSAVRCYDALSDTLSVVYNRYLSTDSLAEDIIKQKVFRDKNYKFTLDIQKSKRIIDISSWMEAESWNVNVTLSNELCKDI